jgi:hypothetical protein
MLEAEIIKPPKKRGKINCDDCPLEYSNKDYRLLYKSKKLIYFNFLFPETNCPLVLCHDCLFRNIKKISNGKTVKVKLYSDDKEYYCEFF